MWGKWVLVAIILAFLYWMFLIYPGDRAHHRKKLEIVRKKLERLEAREAEGKEQEEEKDKKKIDRESGAEHGGADTPDDK